MSKRKIIYISKYALTPANGFSSRQFFISKHLSKNFYKVLLVSSFSCGYSANINGYSKAVNGVFHKLYDALEHYLIPGSEINLGFNLKRIISWAQFEWRVFKFLKKLEVDSNDVVLVSSLSLLTIVNGIIIKRRTNCKLIFEVRDIWPLTLIQIGGMSRWNPLILFLSFIEKCGYQKSDLIVGTMPRLDLHIKSRIKGKFNFVYIPMGFDEETFIKSKREEKLKQCHLDGKFVVCYAGAVGTVNRVEDILEAASIVENMDDKIFFRIIGSGPLLNVLKHKYQHLSNVEFLPWLSKGNLNNELANVDLLLHPVPKESIYQFGISPNKWIDYMYSGKPILLSYDGQPTILHQANCVFDCSPENPHSMAKKIIQIKVMDIAELNKMGNDGKAYLIENLSYDKLAKSFIKKIEELFEAKFICQHEQQLKY